MPGNSKLLFVRIRIGEGGSFCSYADPEDRRVFTDSVSGQGTAIGRVRPSVCLHSSISTDIDLDLYTCIVGHDHRSTGIESQCHKSRSRVSNGGNEVGLTSILDPELLGLVQSIRTELN